MRTPYKVGRFGRVAHRLRSELEIASKRQVIACGALCGIYLLGLGVLTGVMTERIRADRARIEVVRAQQERQRLARQQAIRLEVQHLTEHPAAPTTR